MKQYIRYSIQFSLAFLTLVGLVSVALAAWLPGKGVKWVEYGNGSEPIDRYTAETIDGLSVYTDSATGLSWAMNNQTSAPWSSAVSHCSSLGTPGQWRLPHRNELLSLTQEDLFNPATSIPSAVSTSYWSATEYAGNTSSAWRVLLSYGHVYSTSKAYSNQVVCVSD